MFEQSTRNAATSAGAPPLPRQSDTAVASCPTALRGPVRPASQRFLPVLLLLFMGSGCAALIYEIVWLQLLQLVIGSSGVSLGVLLGSFMGGMCLGSLALPRIVSPRWHPLRVYAALELAIGGIGVGLLHLAPFVGRSYTQYVGYGYPSIALRALVCAACLLPPTMLMGATLPAIARWMRATPRGISQLGFFYGANIAGAVFGCLLAGFYLLRLYDQATATYVAAAINATVALGGLALAAASPHHWRGELAPAPSDVRRSAGNWSAYVAIGLSGLCALGAEVLWTRQLSLLLGATVYTFSIILAVFLIGLGIGSSLGAYAARNLVRPIAALGWCQLLLAGAIAWTAHMLGKSLPFWPIDPTLSASPWFNLQLDLLRCLWSLLPATILWGASFPLALAAVSSRGRDTGRLVGSVYAANTTGAIVGALGFSLLLIGWLGTQAAQQLLIGLSCAAALIVLVPLTWQSWRAGRRRSRGLASPNSSGGVAGNLTAAAAAVLAGAFAWSVPAAPPGLVAYGRFLASSQDRLEQYLYVGEGMNASIAVTELYDGTRNFHVSGKVVASSEPHDMRLQRMLGHAPALLHPRPRSVLVVGCGAGVTAGCFVVHPSIERIVVCEIEPLIPATAQEYFAFENHGVLDDPRVQVVFDDARHFIFTTDERFDIITSDPIHPWVKGAAALYSQEYYQLCKRRLNEGGVVTQWVPLYETNQEAVRSEIATFFSVFPGGSIWGNDIEGEGYDIVMLGRIHETKIDPDQLQQRLQRPDHAKVLSSLKEVNLDSALALLQTYAGAGPDLTPWLKGAQINHDGNMRLQFLAGMGLNSYEAAAIYQSMLAYRKYPRSLFVSKGPRGRALESLLQSQPSDP